MNANNTPSRRPRSQRGFTLIEILVALGIFSILLTIIMVPLNMGVNMTRIGSARTDTQQAAQATMNQIVTELRGATYVFPNEPMDGITDKPPYTNNKLVSTDRLGFPYFRGINGDEDACSNNTRLPFANTSRLDFLTPATHNPIDPQFQNSIVSFYTARVDTRISWDKKESYSADLNPIALYRAQIPFQRTDNATQFLVGGKPNALIGEQRLPDTSSNACTSDGANTNQGARWLMHNGAGEPFLVLQTNTSDTIAKPNPAFQDDLAPTASMLPTDPASNTRITPLGIGLYAPQADNDTTTPTNMTELAANTRIFKPSTTFICQDTNNNGIIDRVTVTLVMGKYDGAGAQNRAQSVRLVQTVDLPNTESRFANQR